MAACGSGSNSSRGLTRDDPSLHRWVKFGLTRLHTWLLVVVAVIVVEAVVVVDVVVVAAAGLTKSLR